MHYTEHANTMGGGGLRDSTRKYITFSVCISNQRRFDTEVKNCKREQKNQIVIAIDRAKAKSAHHRQGRALVEAIGQCKGDDFSNTR